MRAQFLLALLGHAAAQNLVALLNGDFEELDGAVAVAVAPAGAPADDDGGADDGGDDDDGGGQWRLMGTSPCCVLWSVESSYRVVGNSVCMVQYTYM